MLDWFTKIANDMTFSKKACASLSQINSTDFDCMHLSVLDAPDLHHKPVISRITDADATNEQYLDAITTFCKRYMAHHWRDFMIALENQANKLPLAKLYQLCVTKGALFMQAIVFGRQSHALLLHKRTIVSNDKKWFFESS